MKSSFVPLLMLTLTLTWVTRAASGQDPDLVMFVSIESVQLGAPFMASVSFDNSGTASVDGWSLGVCIGDPGVIQATSAANSTLVATINGGLSPGFSSLSAEPALGWTQGVVIDFFGVNKLSPGLGRALATLHGSSSDVGTSSLTICDTLGSPPVSSVVVIASLSVTPVKVPGNVEVLGGPQPFAFVAGTNSPIQVNYDPGAPSASIPVPIEFGIRRDAANTGQTQSQGFSMDCACDGVYLMPISIAAVGSLAALNGGTGPGFVTSNVAPSGGCGWTIGVVYSFAGGVFINFPSATPSPVVRVVYRANASSLIGNLSGVNSPLTWVETLGSPPVANVIVVDGASLNVTYLDAVVEIVPVIDVSHRRGDCNNDGTVNVADAIAAIQVVVGNLPVTLTPCQNACDANNDNLFDTSDGVFIISYQFLNGPPPSAPFPGCGLDAGTSCGSFTSCP